MLWGPSQNRWVDKSFSVIVTSGGNAGINFEHAWGDGAVVLSFFNKGIELHAISKKKFWPLLGHFLAFNNIFLKVHEHIVNECGISGETQSGTSSIGTHSDSVTEIKFKLSDNMKNQIQNAVEFHNTQIQDLEVSFSQVKNWVYNWVT